MRSTTLRAGALHPGSRTAILLFILAIALASCAGSGPSAGSSASPQAMATGQAPSPTTAETTTPLASATAASQGTSAPSSDVPSGQGAPTATPVPPPGGAFTLLRMATGADASQPAPDARTFTTSFPAKAPALYVIFALRTGLAGKVSCAITANGAQAVPPITLSYGRTNSWGDFRISSRGTFVVGSYRAILTFASTGEVATVDFTVR